MKYERFLTKCGHFFMDFCYSKANFVTYQDHNDRKSYY